MTAARQPHEPGRITVNTMIAELTRPRTNRQHYTAQIGTTLWSNNHLSRVPSLLQQLEHAAPSGDGRGRSGGYESRPVARLETLDVLATIDNESSSWVRRLGADDPGHTDRCVLLVGTLLRRARNCDGHPKPGCCPAHELEHDVRRWWAQARIVTGWDEPPWRPDVTCPVCGKRGGLRIRLDERVGMCVECRTSWAPGDYQQLADHVRAESAADRTRSAEPCWCPVPNPVDRIDQLCRRCGSGRCHRAIAENHARRDRQAEAARRPAAS